MTPEYFGLSPAAVDVLGLTLLHFLWQGAVLALALFGALRLSRPARPDLPYAAACLTLLAMLSAPCATALVLSRSAEVADVDRMAAEASGPGAIVRVSSGSPAHRAPRAGAPPAREPEAPWAPALPALVLAWCCGVLVLAARFAGGAVQARKLTAAVAPPADPEWQAALSRLAGRMGVRRPVRLVVSGLVSSPATLGWLRPVVLVPASAFVGLTPQQLEAVLAHELAHIRRLDFLINLLQIVAETLLFYHPAVWWVSSVIRRERELICDDLAVRACGDPLVYARALTGLERLRGPRPQLALGAGGGEFYERVRRLVDPAGGSRPRRGAGSVLALAVAGLVMLPGFQALRLSHVPSFAAGAQTETPQELGVRGPEAFDWDPAARAAAEDALRGRRGCAVVVDARNGRLLAVANEEWAARREWPVASEFKLVTSLAALSEGLVDADRLVRVSDAPTPLDLESALARSSNAYFLGLGGTVGSERLSAYARALGLTERTSASLPGELPGRAAALATDARTLGGMGSGVFVTPLQIARLTGVIAKGDTSFDLTTGPEPAVRSGPDIPEEAFRRVRDGMRACASRGTASRAFAGADVAGKTASAQLEGSQVGMFACFAPADAPRWIVVVALDEPGVFGADAADVAAAILGRLGEV
jgi:beta-lactamase regulating signal transducer with metallopeptidase domain